MAVTRCHSHRVHGQAPCAAAPDLPRRRGPHGQGPAHHGGRRRRRRERCPARHRRLAASAPRVAGLGHDTRSALSASGARGGRRRVCAGLHHPVVRALRRVHRQQLLCDQCAGRTESGGNPLRAGRTAGGTASGIPSVSVNDGSCLFPPRAVGAELSLATAPVGAPTSVHRGIAAAAEPGVTDRSRAQRLVQIAECPPADPAVLMRGGRWAVGGCAVGSTLQEPLRLSQHNRRAALRESSVEQEPAGVSCLLALRTWRAPAVLPACCRKPLPLPGHVAGRMKRRHS